MPFKYISLFAFIAAASAGVLSVAPVHHPTGTATTAEKYVAPVTYAHPHGIPDTHTDDHYNPHSQYKFAYEVNDEHTGDSHGHQEERDGDVVHGEYSLMDADGFKRIVQYNVNSHSGFNAVVNRIPSDHHAKAFKVPVAAPTHSHVASPTVYHQHH